jgi:hypothetical protein
VTANNWRIEIGIVFIGVLSFLLIRYFIVEQRGANTKEQLVAHYITALRDQNADQMIALLPSSHTIDREELSAIFGEVAGKDLKTFEVFSIPSETPTITILDLREAPTENEVLGELIGRIYLQQQNGRWYLLLGRDKNGLSPDTPSTQID